MDFDGIFIPSSSLNVRLDLEHKLLGEAATRSFHNIGFLGTCDGVRFCLEILGCQLDLWHWVVSRSR